MKVLGWHKSCYNKFSNNKIERVTKKAQVIVKVVALKPKGLDLVLAICLIRMLSFL